MARTFLTTDRQIAALQPKPAPYETGVSGYRGLYVRTFPTGTRKFEFRYTSLCGARRRLILGTWPDLSLADARRRTGALRQAVQDGQDPAAVRAAEKAQARTGETLSELAESYWAAAAKGLHGGRRRPKRDSTIQTERHWWRNHIEKKLGDRRFQELRRTDIRLFMKDLVLETQLAPASVASVGALLQSVLQYAVLEERLDANPAVGLARPLALTSRDRLFSDDALAVIWKAAGRTLDGTVTPARIAPEMGLAVRFLMLTLARRAEAAGARWSEFDLDARTWTIPTARAKAGHIQVVPLTAATLSILEDMRRRHPHGRFVFPSPRDENRHLDPHALTRAFARICEQHGLPKGSPHDVRRSGATTLIGRYRVNRMVAGLLLGHTPRDGAAATSVYDRHTYLAEKRDALDAWSRHLMKITSDSPAPARTPVALRLVSNMD